MKLKRWYVYLATLLIIVAALIFNFNRNPWVLIVYVPSLDYEKDLTFKWTIRTPHNQQSVNFDWVKGSIDTLVVMENGESQARSKWKGGGIIALSKHKFSSVKIEAVFISIGIEGCFSDHHQCRRSVDEMVVWEYQWPPHL